MSATSTDRGLRLRLAYLRQRRGPDRFPTEEPTTGQDRTGAVTLHVDASGWVITSTVAHLDSLRRPDAFVDAIKGAYGAAALNRLALEARSWRGPAPTPDEERRGREIVEGRRRLEVPPRPHFPRWELPTRPVPTRVSVPIDPGVREYRGRSRDGEITVSATVAAGLGAITVDGDWLASTSVELAHYALREAFEDLRENGAH